MSAKIKYIFSLLLLFNIGLVLYYFNQRDIFYIDEQWSYAHANSTQGAFLSPTIDSHFNDVNHDISYKWIDGKVFHDYLTVQKDEQFRYAHIWENLEKDVHPPLFYVVLHMVCSFFPDVFNKWLGGSINILFFALTLLMLYKLSKLVLQDDVLALMPVFLWGFSNVGIGAAMYLRMYMLQTFFAVGLVYETLLLLEENKVSGKRLGLVYLYSALGILTQYNSLIFSFWVAVAGGVVLLCRKNWRLLFGFGGCMLLSAVTLFVIFPDAYDVLLHSQRGDEIGGRTKQLGSFLFWVLRTDDFFEICLTQLFSFRKVSSSIFVVFFILGFMAICSRQKNMNVRLLLFVCVCMSLFLALFMPGVYLYWSRYFMFVMPFVAILTIYLFMQAGTYFTIQKKFVVLFLSILITVNSFWADFGQRSAFSFQGNMDTDMLFRKMRHKRLIIVSPVICFFAGVEFYTGMDKVFKTDDICSNLEERKNADYLLLFNSEVKSMGNEDKVRKKSSEGKCMDNLEFLSVVKLSSDALFDLYRVVK